MANPQKELGHIEIANDIAEKLVSSPLSGAELRILIFIIRKTWGWNKKKDKISISQIVGKSQLDRSTVCEVLNKLVGKRLLLKEKGRINTLQFNKDYDQWVVGKRQLGSREKTTTLVGKSHPKVVGKSPPTIDNKDTITKDTITIIPKGIEKISNFRNEDINFLIGYLKEKLGLPLLDDTDKINRRYCWLILKKFGGRDKVKLLIEATAQHEFWSTRITSFKQLYYKGVNIISSGRDIKHSVTKL